MAGVPYAQLSSILVESLEDGIPASGLLRIEKRSITTTAELVSFLRYIRDVIDNQRAVCAYLKQAVDEDDVALAPAFEDDPPFMLECIAQKKRIEQLQQEIRHLFGNITQQWWVYFRMRQPRSIGRYMEPRKAHNLHVIAQFARLHKKEGWTSAFAKSLLESVRPASRVILETYAIDFGRAIKKYNRPPVSNLSDPAG
jgi:hypothetical protein